MRPDCQRLFAALEAGWPPAATERLGPFLLRHGQGGGQRVSAAGALAPFSADELTLAIARCTDMARAEGGSPVFQIVPGAGAADRMLDGALAGRGWQRHDPVALYLGRIGALAALDLPPLAAFAHWPPLAVQEGLWSDGGIGPARRAVMQRAGVPKASLLARSNDRRAGTAYLAVSDGIAGLHALVVDPDARRQGSARNMMVMAARWAQEKGAEWLALAVTLGNAPARALYASLGMQVVEHYHYRILPEAGA